MNQLNFYSFNPPPNDFKLLPILQKIKSLYLLWYEYYQILPKSHRYTLGQKVDLLLAELIEAVSTACYLSPQEKLAFIKQAIRKNDTLKIYIMILWETKSLSNNKYLSLSEKISEIGRDLGGWLGKISKQNSSKF